MMSWWQHSHLSRVMKRRAVILYLFVIGFCLVGCHNNALGVQPVKPDLPSSVSVIQESTVQVIPLDGLIAEARAEISGMAWCGVNLILLPQYPHRFSDEGNFVFSIPEFSIESFLVGTDSDKIDPDLIPFDMGNLDEMIEGFEGFEAIAFDGEQFFVTIEARQRNGMMGYMVQGNVVRDCSRLTVNPDSLVSITPQADLDNMSDEALITYQDQVYSLYEANGTNINPGAVAHVFTPSLERISTISMVNVEYRITDATVTNGEGVFWAINYYYPGDTKLQPALDQVAINYGVGVLHNSSDSVEHLLAFSIQEDGIELVDREPIYMALLDEEARNWEGLVKFGEGFLLVTDKFTTTILAYVEEVGSD